MPPKWEWMDVCDVKNHGLSDPKEAAVFCYVASFMSKMLWELTLCPPLGWCRKTEEHVRIHFTPYMGGSAVTAKVATDKPSDPNCFMEALPKVGHWLVAPSPPETPFSKVLNITK